VDEAPKNKGSSVSVRRRLLGPPKEHTDAAEEERIQDGLSDEMVKLAKMLKTTAQRQRDIVRRDNVCFSLAAVLRRCIVQARWAGDPG
jgi:hypothetical protein